MFEFKQLLLIRYHNVLYFLLIVSSVCEPSQPGDLRIPRYVFVPDSIEGGKSGIRV